MEQISMFYHYRYVVIEKKRVNLQKKNIKLKTTNYKQFNISKKKEKKFNENELRNMISLFRQLTKGEFYIMDYDKQKLILEDLPTPISIGYSRELVQKEGLNFYRLILDEKELGWLRQMNKSAHDILQSYPENQRKKIEFYYNLNTLTNHKREVVLYHKLVPYQLCLNGNMWLGLCVTSLSPFQSIYGKAVIVNTVTNKKYDFDGKTFVPSKSTILTEEDLNILEWMINDFPAKEMCNLLGISRTHFFRRVQQLYKKLDAKSPASAIYKAQAMGFI